MERCLTVLFVWSGFGAHKVPQSHSLLWLLIGTAEVKF